MRRCILFLILVFAVGQPHAATIYVKPNGTGDYPTIQAAIFAASSGDVILCAAGTYSWSNQGTGNDYGMIQVYRGAPNMTIRSESGAEVTILDGQYQGRVFFFQGGDTRLVIDGFTFTHGDAKTVGDQTGSAFAAHLSSPIIKNSIFRENRSNGGGVYWFGGQGAPELRNCLFENNSADNSGGAVLFINSPFDAQVINCVFRNNSSTGWGGAIYAYNFGATIRGCTFHDNYARLGGGAIAIFNSNTMLITRCTMFRNNVAGGGASMTIVSSPLVTVSEVIMMNGVGGPAVDINDDATVFTCTDIFGHLQGNWTGLLADDLGVNGNFSEDPLFCSPGSGDFKLAADSPCAFVNQPEGSICGRIGSHIIGCGAVPIEESTWGAVKALYSGHSDLRFDR